MITLHIHERVSSKTRLRKASSLGIKCVSLLDINFDMKKIYNFPNGLFFCGFRGGNEKIADIRAGLLSHLVASLLDFTFVATSGALVLRYSRLCSNISLLAGQFDYSALSSSQKVGGALNIRLREAKNI